MNLYKELNITEDASKAEIKKAYKKAASVNHPDKGGDEKKFQAVKLAYDVLSDSERKARYDATGEIDSGQPQQDPIESRITQLFSSMIDEGKFSGNIVDEAIDIVRSAIGDLVSASCKVDTSLKKLNKRLGRITCKDDNNMFEIVLSGKISELADRLSKMDDEAKIMDGVLERLANYSDDLPEPKYTAGRSQWENTSWPNSL